MAYCSKCDARVRANAAFCPECGAEFEDEEPNEEENIEELLGSIKINSVESEDNAIVLKNLQDKKFESIEHFKLRLVLEHLSKIEGFETLKCLKVIKNVDSHSYQEDAVFQVLREFRGRALIADDVGLGKTIEAGMILKEYTLHGLVKKVLILVPKAILGQWQKELKLKFCEDFDIYESSSQLKWLGNDDELKLITTYKVAENNAKILEEIEWDMLIVDEAHRLRNKKNGWYFINKHIHTKYFLMLTATPLQNDIRDLYNLVYLIDPTILGTIRSFNGTFLVRGDRMRPANPGKLKGILHSRVLIRRKRGETDIYLPERKVEIIPVTLTKEEKRIYDLVTKFAKQEHHYYLERNMLIGKTFMELVLQQGVVSSVYAVRETLAKIRNNLNLTKRTREIASDILEESQKVNIIAKAEKLLTLLKNHIRGNKAIIFTDRLQTQEFLYKFLSNNGYKNQIIKFGAGGDIDKDKRDFEKTKQILLSTDKGSEGLNFQFCNRLINYDLHWNPMRIEQRIGRIHRIGQKSIVYIYNLASKDTVEQHVVELLFKKLQLFRSVIGEPDAILANMDSDIKKFIYTSETYEEEAEKFRLYGLEKAKEEAIIKKARAYI